LGKSCAEAHVGNFGGFTRPLRVKARKIALQLCKNPRHPAKRKADHNGKGTELAEQKLERGLRDIGSQPRRD
jgi:hypothetical protein